MRTVIVAAILPLVILTRVNPRILPNQSASDRSYFASSVNLLGSFMSQLMNRNVPEPNLNSEGNTGLGEEMGFESDKSFEKRFYGLINSNSFALKYVNMLVNSYSLEIFNTCVAQFKLEYEAKQDQILNGFQESTLKGNAEHSSEVGLKVTRSFQKEAFALFLKSKSVVGDFQQNVAICEDFYDFLNTHFFMSKKMFTVERSLFYFQDQYLYEDPDYFQQRPFLGGWFEKMRQLALSAEFLSLEKAHQSYFYDSLNHFIRNTLNFT